MNIDNEFGVEFEEIGIKRIRMHRTDGKWLIEYQRTPQWPLGLDGFWWWNDSTYTEHDDALIRVEHLSLTGVIRKVRFKKTRVIDMRNS